uniref:Uncharacterized protein n=1 Tax=Strigamia maritima TaxID=126957 RepID=T1JFT3_STRMM
SFSTFNYTIRGNVYCNISLQSFTHSLTHSQVNATSYYNYPFAKYTLPECATQQVCNAVYTRLNRINSLCECPNKYENSCSISFRNDDRHTIQLATDKSGKALTLVKTCEPVSSVRQCKGPHDWAILALQNVRTGKSHYLVTCRCSANGLLEGPVAHENPPYAKIPGIRVFGMICKTTKSVHRKSIYSFF